LTIYTIYYILTALLLVAETGVKAEKSSGFNSQPKVNEFSFFFGWELLKLSNMTNPEIKQYFDFHNENMRLLKIGFNNIRDQLKDLYKTKNNSGEYIFSFNENTDEKNDLRKIEKTLSRILSGIQVSWAEESIKRLLYENNLLNDIQRTYLLNQKALNQRWYKTLKIVYSIAYNIVPTDDDICETVTLRKNISDSDDPVNKYVNLKQIITNQLTPNFSIRNKVQHGEWVYAFTGRGSSEFSQDLTDKLHKENIVTTMSRFTIVNALYQMIVDIGRFKSNNFALDSSTTPFEYFYSSYINKIYFEINKIDNSNIEKYIINLIERERKGIYYRTNN